MQTLRVTIDVFLRHTIVLELALIFAVRYGSSDPSLEHINCKCRDEHCYEVGIFICTVEKQIHIQSQSVHSSCAKNRFKLNINLVDLFEECPLRRLVKTSANSQLPCCYALRSNSIRLCSLNTDHELEAATSFVYTIYVKIDIHQIHFTHLPITAHAQFFILPTDPHINNE